MLLHACAEQAHVLICALCAHHGGRLKWKWHIEWKSEMEVQNHRVAMEVEDPSGPRYSTGTYEI